MKYEAYHLTPEMFYEVLMSQEKQCSGGVINGIPGVLFKGACTCKLCVYK